MVRPAGLDPWSIAALPLPGRWVWTGPPLLANGWRFRAAPNGRLKALAAERVKPLPLPMALWSAVTVAPVATVAMSARPLAAALPATIVLCKLIVPVPAVSAMPPPPAPSAVSTLPAELLVMVLFCTSSVPPSGYRAMPPPEPLVAVLPEMVLLRMVRPVRGPVVATVP